MGPYFVASMLGARASVAYMVPKADLKLVGKFEPEEFKNLTFRYRENGFLTKCLKVRCHASHN